MNDIDDKLKQEAAAPISRLSALGLKKKWDKVSGIMKISAADEVMTPAKIICLSLETGRVSMVYGRRILKRIKLIASRSYVVNEGRYATPEFTASCLSLALEEFDAGGSKVILNIPKEWTILQTADLPMTVKENLATALNYELDRLTPLNPDEAYWDFKILKEEDNKIEVFIAATKADFIDPYLRAIREKGIQVGGMTFHLAGIGALFNYIRYPDDVLFLEINEDSYDGMLMKEGVIAEPFSDFFGTDDENAKTQQVLNEILPYRDYFLTQNKSPLIIIYHGSGGYSVPSQKIPFQAKELKDIMQTSLLNKLVEGDIVKDQWKAAGGALEYLWPKAVRFNLLNKGQREQQKTPLALTISLLLLILSIGILYWIAPLELERRKQEVMNTQIQAMKEEVKKVEMLKKDVDILGAEIVKIHDFKENRYMSLSIIQELTSLLPKTAWLTRVRITDKGLDIEGYASRATEILPKLENSPFFAKVEFASPTVRDTRVNADRFIIKMELEPGNLKKGMANK